MEKKKSENTSKTRSPHELREVAVAQCDLLERNPQFLTAKQMTALQRSIERDGFVAPILVVPHGQSRFEIVSGNHRFMAAKALGYVTVPAVVGRLSSQDAKRLALNLNLIHGQPQAEQLAPFLAELDDDTLNAIHLDDDMLTAIGEFDEELKARLDSLTVPSAIDNDSSLSPITRCKCHCGNLHMKSTSEEQTTMRAQSLF